MIFLLVPVWSTYRRWTYFSSVGGISWIASVSPRPPCSPPSSMSCMDPGRGASSPLHYHMNARHIATRCCWQKLSKSLACAARANNSDWRKPTRSSRRQTGIHRIFEEEFESVTLLSVPSISRVACPSIVGNATTYLILIFSDGAALKRSCCSGFV